MVTPAGNDTELMELACPRCGDDCEALDFDHVHDFYCAAENIYWDAVIDGVVQCPEPDHTYNY